jgi:predicted permease
MEANFGGSGWNWLVGHSLRNLERLQAHGPWVSAIGAEVAQSFAVRAETDTVSVAGAFVSGHYFAALGTQPKLGRLIGPLDDRTDTDAAVIGTGLWRRLFDDSPTVLGQTVTVLGRRFRVIGVAPDRFNGLARTDLDEGGDDQQIWLPLTVARGWPGVDLESALRIAVRHAPGIDRDHVQRELNGLAGTLDPPTSRGQARPFRLALREHGYGPTRWNAEAIRSAVVFLLPFLAVLVIACANVANLRLASATARVRELAVRFALGGTRSQIVRLLAAESAVLTAGAALLAWLLTRFVLFWLGRFFPMSLAPDLMVAAFVVAVSVGVLFLSGIAPAWRVTVRVQASGLRETTQSGGRAHSRLRNALVAVQVAVSIGLLVITAMSVRTITGAIHRTADLTDGLLQTTIHLEDVGYDGPAATRFAQTLLERLRADRRVTRAAISSAPILTEREEFYARPGDTGTTRRFAFVTRATPGWLDILQVRTLAGRLLTEADRGMPVAVVNETMARALAPDAGSALGMPVRITGFQSGSAPPATVTIVGIVTDAVRPPSRAGLRPAVYLPLSDEAPLVQTLALRTSDPERLFSEVRRLITEVEPRAPVAFLESGSAVLARETRPIRLFAWGFGTLGALALLLATAGLYAVCLYVTTLRTREIGIRVAIGARQNDVIGLIVRQALRVVGLGIVTGLVLVIPIASAMRALFVGVSPIDPLSLGPTVLILLLAGLAAAVIPALRASRIDPVVALRQE